MFTRLNPDSFVLAGLALILAPILVLQGFPVVSRNSQQYILAPQTPYKLPLPKLERAIKGINIK